MKTMIYFLLLVWITPALWANDWPFYRGPALNGASEDSDWNPRFPPSGPEIAWEKDLGIGASSFVVVGETVITTGNKGNEDILWSLNTEDGSVNWAYRYPCNFEKRMFEGGTASTPTVAGGVVFNLSYDGQLHAVDLNTGKKIWQKHMIKDYGGKLSRWKYAGSPLIVNDKLFLDIGGRGNSTLALDPKTGNKIWGEGKEQAGYATIIPYQAAIGDALLVFKGEALLGISQSNGQQLWRYPWKTSYDVNASTPIVSGKNALVSSGYPGGRAALLDLSGSKPKQLWRNDDIKTKMNTCVIHDGYAFAVTEKKGQLIAVNLRTGKTAWAERGTGQYGTLSIAGGILVVLTESGELWTVKASGSKFQLISKGKVLEPRCWVTPTIAHGRVFAKNNRGKMVCVDLRK